MRVVFLAGLALLVPSRAFAWVSAYLERVDTAVTVEADGAATSDSTARFVIEAGKFRELRLLDVPLDVTPDLDASWVEDDEGRRYRLELQGRRHDDGILRLQLADEAKLGKGRATCRLVLRENWVETGRATRDGAATAVDWHPALWPDGMERMTVSVSFAGDDGTLQFSVPEDLVVELEPRSAGRTLTLSKFRPSAQYAMPVRFTAQAPGAGGAVLAAAPPAAPAPTRAHRSRPPAERDRAETLPFFAAFGVLGLLLLVLRARHARRVAGPEGGVQTYLFLPSLGPPLRWPAVAGALAAGAWLLWREQTLAGFAAQAVGVLLALPDRFRWMSRPAAGVGPWRSLAAPSPRTWRSLAGTARRARRSALDPAGPTGLLLLLALAGVVVAAMDYGLFGDVEAWIVVGADAALLFLPPFLAAAERALPPILPAEAGVALDRVRRWALRRGRGRGFEVSFLVQDDEAGRPAELRMRVRRPAATFARSAEVAVEWRLTRWGWHPTYALLLDLPAGSRLRASAAFPADASCRLADGLERETWVLRAPTPRSAARRLLHTMQAAEAECGKCGEGGAGAQTPRAA
ncbi:MAG: hypothetical protein HY907_04765 [Deltaproteobacteria bacterium]|nr:hypothetical protein [Deltaproteobacteria bacterium]